VVLAAGIGKIVGIWVKFVKIAICLPHNVKILNKKTIFFILRLLKKRTCFYDRIRFKL
jgi:hypothetical protein